MNRRVQEQGKHLMIFPLNALPQFVVQGFPNPETGSLSLISYMVNINQISQEQVAEIEKAHCNFSQVFKRVRPLSSQLPNTSLNP